MNNKIVKIGFPVNDDKLIFETGRFAHFASGAVLARLGETIVHATVVRSDKDSDLSYFPLHVQYQEKLYAGGIIKGSRWVKREGRPSDEAILVSRLIDRSIRPLFPENYRKDIQVIITVLSVDGKHSPDVLGILAASAALHISDIPWAGPIAAARVGLVDKQLIVNPVESDQEKSQLDLVVSGRKDAVVMVEAGADEVKEPTILQAFEKSQAFFDQAVKTIEELRKKAGRKKSAFQAEKLDPELKKDLSQKINSFLKKFLLDLKTKKTDKSALDDLVERLNEKLPETKKLLVKNLVQDLFKKAVRKKLFKTKKRIDGRSIDKIRPLDIDIDLFPQTHGSAMFQRGNTQAVTIVTLASPAKEQLIESMEGEATKRYIHHYYMPPFSVGETGRLGWPSRREIGHGALAERALMPVIPDEDEFSYTIRVVSEIMTSNGSTSMASVCGSSLSLMDAGVPIKKPVAGIAMGLVTRPGSKEAELKNKDCLVLTDIQGVEDHLGDMDFKVAGTKDGINALQMDIKIKGVNLDILKQALERARKARLFILEEMNKIISKPKKSLSKYAPKIMTTYVPENRIGDVIGPGGRTIRAITKQTEATIDVNDEGRVTITGEKREAVEKALEWVEGLTHEVKPGEEYTGEVTRVEKYGVFVKILPGQEGLVHISRMSSDYVSKPEDICKLGDEVKVWVTEIDDMDRIALSMVSPEERQKKSSSKKQHRSQKPYSKQK